MDFRQGQPRADGRYLCIVESDLQPSWALPVLLTWRGEWLLPTSEKPHRPRVYAWDGPLPIGRLSEMFSQEKSPTEKHVAGILSAFDAINEPTARELFDAGVRAAGGDTLEYDL